MRILIAEDDQVLADGLLRTLRASGAVVDHVASGAEAAGAEDVPGHARWGRRKAATRPLA